MSGAVVGALGVVLGVAGGLSACHGLRRRFRVSPEVLRKGLHVGSGLACATIPFWCGDRVLPVVAASTVVAALLLVARFAPRLEAGVGSLLTGVGRATEGELHFLAGVVALHLLARGDPLRFLVPLAILTFADPVAAAAGRRFARPRPAGAPERKTLAGSLAFAAVAFLVAAVGLRVGTTVSDSAVLLGAAVLALSTAATEHVARRGLDNLVVPLVAWGALAILASVPPGAAT